MDWQTRKFIGYSRESQSLGKEALLNSLKFGVICFGDCTVFPFVTSFRH